MSASNPSPAPEASASIATMGDSATATHPIDEMERSRAGLYRLLAALLARAPDAALLAATAGIAGPEGPFGDALRGLASAARNTTVAATKQEYDTLFVGITHGELIPYASFYLTGFLYERPLARLREDMILLEIGLVDGRSDPEDHLATIFEVMSSLIDGAATPAQPIARQHDFFRRHIEPWAGRFFADLESAAAANFYRPLGTLGRLLVELEREAFLMESA